MVRSAVGPLRSQYFIMKYQIHKTNQTKWTLEFNPDPGHRSNGTVVAKMNDQKQLGLICITPAYLFKNILNEKIIMATF